MAPKDKKNEIIAGKQDLCEGVLKIMLVRAKDLQGNDSKDSSDPYVKFFFENYGNTVSTVKSKTKKYTINPVWN
jgi:Ca2+-dependent lipid-binding protein